MTPSNRLALIQVLTYLRNSLPQFDGCFVSPMEVELFNTLSNSAYSLQKRVIKSLPIKQRLELHDGKMKEPHKRRPQKINDPIDRST